MMDVNASKKNYVRRVDRYKLPIEDETVSITADKEKGGD